MSNINTAIQVTDFDFYGDSLIAIQDNSTGEIYAAINHILRNIGFTVRQVRNNRDKWIKDIVISKGVQNFVIPTKTGLQDTYCISNRKLPIGLTKLTLTPKMKHDQPELVKKLELYQDKCADVLASVFIDHRSSENIILQPLLDAMTSLTQTITTMQQDIITLKKQHQSMQKPKKDFHLGQVKCFLNISS